MKEHKGTVTSIHIRRNHLECVSSSSDGSCIVWDLTRFVRNQVLFAPSFFKAVKYYPDESQLLTSGTDRKVAYWEAFDGSLIREIEASQTDAINSLDITKDGAFFVIGGSDRLVKVYSLLRLSNKPVPANRLLGLPLRGRRRVLHWSRPQHRNHKGQDLSRPEEDCICEH